MQASPDRGDRSNCTKVLSPLSGFLGSWSPKSGGCHHRHFVYRSYRGFACNFVDRDSSVSPLDVLVLVNWLNSGGSPVVSKPLPARPIYYLDVDGDNTISPLDVLVLINYLNRPKDGEGSPRSKTRFFLGSWTRNSVHAKTIRTSQSLRLTEKSNENGSVQGDRCCDQSDLRFATDKVVSECEFGKMASQFFDRSLVASLNCPDRSINSSSNFIPGFTIDIAPND